MAEIITLEPSDGPDGSVLWKMCQVRTNKCGGTADGTPYPEIDIQNGAKNSLVAFSITGENSITFRKAADPYDPVEAFYVEPGQGKSPGKGIDSDGQFENVILANGKTLIFNDKNSKPGYLSYKLHFQRENTPVTSIDPDIRNGGGGGGSDSLITEASASLIIGAAVLIALVAGAVGGLVVKRFG